MRKPSEGTVFIGGIFALAIWLFVVLPFLIGPRQYFAEASEPHAEATATAQSSQQEPRGTAEQPFFVQVISSPKSAEERHQEAEDRDEKKDADRWLVRWTAALFVATVGLILATGVLGYFGYRQAGDMQDSVAAAKSNAAAAEIQAHAIIQAERPYVFLTITEPGIELLESGQLHFPGRLRFSFINYGKTPALLTELMEYYPIIEGRNDTPAPVNPMVERGRLLPIGSISAPGFPYTLATNIFTAADISRLLSANSWNDRRLFFQGFIRFTDAFGTHYVTGFLAAFSSEHSAWALRGGEKYNYTREEKLEDIPPHPRA